MRFLAIIAAVVALLAPPVAAQDEDGGGFLERTLEESLSGAGYDVRITGFAGALSSQARIETMTISDSEGVWLRLSGVTLDWTRAALLQGRVEVNRLAAREIALLRPPLPRSGLNPEMAEARPFALPELPVSVRIDALEAETILLGAPVLGEEVRLSLSGSLTLGGGEGAAKITAERLDGGRGSFRFDAAFDNVSRVLALDLTLDEGQGGIAATLLNLRDQPALELSVEGTAPLDEYAADLRLATDGVDRLTGRVTLNGIEAGGTRFNAQLEGDLTPLMEAEFQPFFGTRSALDVSGTRAADGTLDIERLRLSTAQVTLEGRLALDAAGWPKSFDLSGDIRDGDGSVRLPIAGAPVTLRQASITARFDAAQGDRWRANVALSQVEQPGLAIAEATLSMRGRLDRAAPRGVTALAEFDLSGVDLADPALAQAAGRALSGHASVEWREGAPVVVRGLRVTSGAATLAAEGQIAALAEGFPVSGRARLDAPDLTRFAALSGLDLAGSAGATLAGSGSLLGGEFDIALDAETNGLALGIAEIDPLIAPPGTLNLKIRRDTEGTTLERLRIANSAVEANAEGSLDSQSGALDVTALLSDLALVDRRLDGPARVSGGFGWRADGAITLEAVEATAMGAKITADGAIQPTDEASTVAGHLSITTDDLSRFAALTGRPLMGRITANLNGLGAVDGQSFDIALDAQTNGLALGIAQLDPLIAPPGTLVVDVRRDTEGTTLERLRIANSAIEATAEGSLDSESVMLDIIAALSDLALVDRRLDGPARVSGGIGWRADGAITLEAVEATAMGAKITADGLIEPKELTGAGHLSVTTDDLSRFAALAGRPLRGRITANLNGSGAANGQSIDIALDAEGRDLATGIADLDRLIAARLDLSAEARRTPERIEIGKIDLATPQLTLTASGGDAGGPIRLDARLANLGLFLPEFSGPVSAQGTATLHGPEARRIELALDATGPGGTTARVSGDVIDHGARLDLAATGQLPLALVNGLIRPNSLSGSAGFNLRAQGAPGLGALSGTVETSGARVSLPAAGIAIDDLTGSARLGQNRAETDFTARLRDGGTVRVTGPISLEPGLDGDLTVALSSAVLTDRLIYTTTASGTVTVRGPLVGGARIGGGIVLETTEIRIPSGLGPDTAMLPGLRHIGEPAASRTTRERARLIETGPRETRARRPYALDLAISAPARIFVRGRGLDAELGGRVRIGGTTTAVAPDGFFELRRGRLDILGKRLDLTQGRVTMQGSLDPWLRFVAETAIDDVDVQVIIEGLASAPEVRFTSSPDLPQEEIVARLIFGRGLDNISPLQAAQLASAVATLSGGGGGLVGRLRSGLGLSDLDVTQTAEGDTEVSVGGYISDKIYTEVTADSAGRQRINLNLDISRNLTAKGSAGSDGEAGIGLFFEKDY